ncbi:MAG: hypothetical protein ACU0CO_11690 [Shimia sp.]
MRILGLEAPTPLRRLVMLSVAILAGAAMDGAHGDGASEQPLDAATFAAELTDVPLAVDLPVVAPILVAHADGRLTAETRIGTFEGRWAMQGETFCTFFDTGPRAGEHCTSFTPVAAGRYAAADGRTITRMAKAHRF